MLFVMYKAYIFSQASNYDINTSRMKYSRASMLSKAELAEFNSYRDQSFTTATEIPSMSDLYIVDESQGHTYNAEVMGVGSLFNKYHAVGVGGNNDPINASDVRVSMNIPLMDTPSNRNKLKASGDCSVRALVQRSHEGYYGTATYSYSDFMYCTHLDEVPNNKLITLRRYPIPVLDNMLPYGFGEARASLISSQTAAPIGTMVTWLGVSGNSMENILKYSYKMSFTEKEAQWEQPQQIGGGTTGPLNTIEALVNPATRNLLNQGSSIQAAQSIQSSIAKLWKGSNGGGVYDTTVRRDKNKVYGPIDAVKKIYMRGSDGLTWDQSFTLVFDYSLKSYNGVNPKQAFLDLIANILTTTYTTGGFWKGGYVPMGVTQSSVFGNMSVFKTSGNFTDFVSAISNDFTSPSSSLLNTLKDSWDNFDPMSFINSVGGVMMGTLLNSLGRPAKYYYPQLLSDAPAGFWHVTIGNPNHPIMTLGNMIVTGTTITHSGDLGIDDFPSNLRVEVTLSRGKPRDQLYTETMYMMGNDRIYLPMEDKYMNMWKNSTRVSGDDNAKRMWAFGTSDDDMISTGMWEVSVGSSSSKKDESTSNKQSKKS